MNLIADSCMPFVCVCVVYAFVCVRAHVRACESVEYTISIYNQANEFSMHLLFMLPIRNAHNMSFVIMFQITFVLAVLAMRASWI